MTTKNKPVFREARTLVTTEVREDGLHIEGFPFPRYVVKFEELRSCEVAKGVNPIRTLTRDLPQRRFSHGVGYSYSGFQGVLLEFKNGKHVLLGSRRPEELAQAIESARKRK